MPVDPPTVEDTISILRGLKERFEVHHGVRIQDSSLVAAALLSARLYWSSVRGTADAFAYGVTTGALLGLLTWVLNYWQLSSLQGGLLLLALFYVLVGLIQQHLDGRFSRQVILEYGGVGLLALLLVFFLA